jgi:hypothetical protein
MATNIFDCINTFRSRINKIPPTKEQARKAYDNVVNRYIDPYQDRLRSQIQQMEKRLKTIDGDSIDYKKLVRQLQRQRYKRWEIRLLYIDLDGFVDMTFHTVSNSNALKDVKNIKAWLISEINFIQTTTTFNKHTSLNKLISKYDLTQIDQKDKFLLHLDLILKTRRSDQHEVFSLLTSDQYKQYFKGSYKELKFRFKYFEELGHLHSTNFNKFLLPNNKLSTKYEYHNIFKEIETFMLDEHRTLNRFSELREEIMSLINDKNISGEQAFLKTLDRWEQKGGFKPVFDMESRYYSRNEFESDLIGSGSLFNDITFAKKTQGYWSTHGEYAHRIQWNLIIREFLSNRKNMLITRSGRSVMPNEVLFEMSKESVNRIYLGTKERRYPRNNVWSIFFEFGPINWLSPNFASHITRTLIPEAKIWTGLIDSTKLSQKKGGH